MIVLIQLSVMRKEILPSLKENSEKTIILTVLHMCLVSQAMVFPQCLFKILDTGQLAMR